jgi:biopolymer transport protein ExbB
MRLKEMSCKTAASRLTATRLAAWLLGLAVIVTLWPAPANAWWNDDWSLRKKITIDTSAAGANITDPIGATPVLVRLHIGNFRFGSAKEDGSDLRFVAGDDKTPLKHHIEKYDSLLGEALVWVGVPDLKPGAKTELWLYFGNRKATRAEDAKNTYDPDTLLVYHFAERGMPALDSSALANNAQNAGTPAKGAIIGEGLRLDGQNPLMLPASPSLTVAENASFTWSVWIKMAAAQPSAVIYSRHDGANALVIGLDHRMPYVDVTRAGVVQRSGAGAPIAAETWHHLAVAASAAQLSLYLDGTPYATLNAGLPRLSGMAVVGVDAVAAGTPAASAPAAAPAALTAATPDTPATPPAPSSGQPAGPQPAALAGDAPAVDVGAAIAVFAGELDELQIAKAARPAGFIKAAAVGQGPEHDKLVTFGLDEEASSWLTGYFVVILKSVTLDGWVVIGLLLIMAVISWVVMVEKAYYLTKQRKANSQFLRSFSSATDLITLDHGEADGASRSGTPESDPGLWQHSSLYRVYLVGAEEIRRRFADPRRVKVLSAPAIAAFRATLDGTFVQETQRLNRTMVVLTIAISGGPFLGLLGTVIGVMITFAAIAASGDVNINAIAPGIAAALVATVAGLGVAIPALFGYNYLITTIRNRTTELQVFIDELVTKMAELYSEQPAEYRMAAE